jgi:hypothetical protein
VNDLQAVAGGIVLPKSVLAIDLRALSHRCDQRVDGILGVDFFRGRIVQIDFTEGRVRILEKCDPKPTGEEFGAQVSDLHELALLASSALHAGAAPPLPQPKLA